MRIGILGGIGPEASSRFYSKMILMLQKKGTIVSNKDYPQIILNSIPAPELIGSYLRPADIKYYCKGIKELSDMDVDFIVVVCNTAHLFLDKMQKMTTSEILNIKKLMSKAIKIQVPKSLLILGTKSTVRSDLYQFPGTKIVYPNSKELDIISSAIYNFNKGLAKKEQRNLLTKICKKYQGQGVEQILIGCTELSVMFEETKLPVIDPMSILLEETVRRATNSKQ